MVDDPDALHAGCVLERRARDSTGIDPHALARAAERYDGLGFLRAIVSGALTPAPFFETVGIRLVEVDEGRAAFVAWPERACFNLIGTVHGGWIATLLDSATGCAVYSTLARGDAWTTLSLAVDYVRPLSDEHERVRCTGRVVRVGRRIGLADGELLGADGRLIARARSTCMIVRAP